MCGLRAVKRPYPVYPVACLFIYLSVNTHRVHSQQRILLNNSPLQNTLREMWTTIHFLLPGITRSYLDFPVKAGAEQNQDYCHKLVIRLYRVGGQLLNTRFILMTVSLFVTLNTKNDSCFSLSVWLSRSLSVDDPAFHPAALQTRRGETVAEEVRAHPEVSPLCQTEEDVRGHSHPAQVWKTSSITSSSLRLAAIPYLPSSCSHLHRLLHLPPPPAFTPKYSIECVRRCI